ncbi:unnamed protein product [Phytophthora fragariaefolia]|uniref:Unnamed protein product n=1 Tax=Phytophthora fragariaefolia TaxID=1490495 RepID=A0A9W7D3U3_9STRA|nr:unnamed protein product [Phytophthora fragariaefolia]
MRPLLLLLLLVLLAATAAAEDALKLQLDAEQPVTVTLADGSTRELTAAEFEQLARERSEQQAKLQPEATGERRQRQELREIQEQDPQFALHIDLARRAFKELQRHGYARGYALAGFSEQLARPSTRQEQADYYVELILTSRQDPSSGVPPKTGSGTKKRDDEPLSYEVQLLLDEQGTASRRRRGA